MTPAELAAEIGMSHRVLRGWLRRQFPRTDDERDARWDLEPYQVAAVRAHFGGRYTPGVPGEVSDAEPPRRVVQAVSSGPSDWFRSLISDTEGPLRRLGVAVWLVAEDGEVEVRLPLLEP